MRPRAPGWQVGVLPLRSMLFFDFSDIILDLLHMAQLGIPKTPWKHGILNNASDDARELISAKLFVIRRSSQCNSFVISFGEAVLKLLKLVRRRTRNEY